MKPKECGSDGDGGNGGGLGGPGGDGAGGGGGGAVGGNGGARCVRQKTWYVELPSEGTAESPGAVLKYAELEWPL